MNNSISFGVVKVTRFQSVIGKKFLPTKIPDPLFFGDKI